MIVTTMNKNQLFSISLPETVDGQYWLPIDDVGDNKSSISIEGINGEWMLKSNRWARIIDKGNAIKSVALSPMSIVPLQNRFSEKSILFVQPESLDRLSFYKYSVPQDIEITIGREPDNIICFSFQAVSSHHATLYRRNGKWLLIDKGSRNGTYVNGLKVSECELKIGDVIFIMGLKVIIGDVFIAVNSPDNKVILASSLRPYSIQRENTNTDEEDEYELEEPEYFYRSPRFMREITPPAFRIDPPPQSPIADELPWALVMGSSVAMGAMSMTMLVTAISTKNIPSIIMGGSMVVATLLIPVVTKVFEKNRKKNKEKARKDRYREYLSQIAERISRESQLQKEISCENNVTVNECEGRILQTSRNLWERTSVQSDFLRVRVGTGEGMLDAEFTYPQKVFSLDDDVLRSEMYALCEKNQRLTDVPITYSLYEDHISGIIGDRKSVLEFAQNLIIQLSALYSYDDVKFVFLYNKREATELDFVRWLPHVWEEEHRFRYVATDINESKEISSQLEGIISFRSGLSESELANVNPYYLIFSFDKELALRSEAIKQILAHKENLRIGVISVFEQLNDIPKECSIVLEMNKTSGRMFDKDATNGTSVSFKVDEHLKNDPIALSKRLLNTPMYSLVSESKMPRMLTFLEMYNVGKVEHLNALARWKRNDPTKSLEAAIGVDSLGEVFKLDLHEKYHGPHGLVAGMTGSGKSEFIISYILSLAVNYHPYEVAFILIDYKGGGMAKSFENLPHTAGIITNLDGSSINRSLISIHSELRRRQSIFSEASKRIGMSNIDIYKYQKLYREGKVSEPLQHLFIISDEFAELKNQQSDFMTQLVSAARIGRSLGIHLILATQKPSGVVDDQIWSNSRFRVCLKVQERADSMDMLKRPDAAELTDAGRFYLQVGYNELFEIGQSAWAGAPYYPADTVQKEKDDSVVVIDTNGRPLSEVKIDKKKDRNNEPPKQLDVITSYLSKIAQEEGIRIRPLWLEPIPASILLDEVKMKYPFEKTNYVLNPVIGEYDDPANQRQAVLTLPISKEGNVAVYGAAGSGKTSFINAMIYALISDYSPEEVNIYVLDFSSETLRAFAKSPHVGDVILAHESEKINNLFKILFSELNDRRKHFSDYGGDYSAYIRNSGETVPNIVVVINNFSAFTEIYEDQEEAVTYLSREGTKYGLYFVLTAITVGSIRFRLLQNFKQIFTLQLNDESDYSTVVGKTEGLIPAKIKGRGLVRRDALYEFQIGRVTLDDMPYMCIQKKCRELDELWEGRRAKKIPVLPKHVDIDFLKDYIKNGDQFELPIGVEKNSLAVHYFQFGKRYINTIMSNGSDYKQFVSDFICFVCREVNHSVYVIDLMDSYVPSSSSVRIANSTKECEEMIDELFDQVLYRNNTYKEALDEKKEIEHFEPIMVIMNSFSSITSLINETANEKLSLILEKGAVTYNVCIVLADQVKAFSSLSYKKWYTSNVSNADGLWIGNGFTEQYTMKANKLTAEMREETSSEYGFSLVDGRAVRLKLLCEHSEEDEYEQ
ncbi:MAG: type VII secretion protein EssC [Clostridiales bacterium]|nr:type VII secretion protein EssC [Candidatus Scatonaster coprocaballi]